MDAAAGVSGVHVPYEDDNGTGGASEVPGNRSTSIDIRDSQGVVVGDHARVTNVFHGAGRVAGSAYLEQVRDIAPRELLDREAELAELAAFCSGDTSYTWWQAGPWAGKSALVSWFVLHPPQGMDVVCFFVTARLAAQADSTAFTEALLEQLASLVGEELPSSLAATARDAHRRLLMRVAVQRARQEGRRLVLVVDGLDEDRSGQSGEGLPSIASLLPRHPDDGLRVIVTGRPHPTVPDDVVSDHPLRVCRVRHLAISEHATDIERLAKEELKRILRSTSAEQCLLGLVTAAQGGLTRTDLEELTTQAPHEVDYILSGVSGRTIMSRAGEAFSQAADRRIYLLAHETLQAESARALGRSRLDGYRDRIHSWADRYRTEGWPENTPAYLLRGYPQMLLATGDRARLVACAIDEKRHDRMLDLTGGDAAGLSEVASALEFALAAPDPDLVSLVRLAAHRDDLIARNENIPDHLPVVWAALGYPLRAEALARSIIDPGEQAHTLTLLAKELAKAGEHEQVRGMAVDIITAARSIADADLQAQMLLRLLHAATRGGDFEHATAAARSITDPYWQDQALTDLGQALAGAGKHEEAITVVRSIADPESRARALVSLIAACVAVAKNESGRDAVAAADTAARSIVSNDRQARTLIDLAAVLAGAGLQGGCSPSRRWSRDGCPVDRRSIFACPGTCGPWTSPSCSR